MHVWVITMRSLCNKHYNHNSLQPCCNWISWVLVGGSLIKLFYNLPHLFLNHLYFRVFCLWHSYEFPIYYKLFHCSQRTYAALLPYVEFFSFCERGEYCDILLLIRVSHQYVTVNRFQVFHFLGLFKLYLLWKMGHQCLQISSNSYL